MGRRCVEEYLSVSDSFDEYHSKVGLNNYEELEYSDSAVRFEVCAFVLLVRVLVFSQMRSFRRTLFSLCVMWSVVAYLCTGFSLAFFWGVGLVES